MKKFLSENKGMLIAVAISIPMYYGAGGLWLLLCK